MRAGPIVVINPNSNQAVTAGLDTALEAYRFAGGPEIECLNRLGNSVGITLCSGYQLEKRGSWRSR